MKFLKGLIAPRMGWKRYGRYLALRLVRLNDTDQSIARGLAHGASISWTPLPGTHFMLAAATSFLTKSNVPAGMFGTLLGTPWTLPFMWWLAYIVGQYTFELIGWPIKQMPADFTWDFLMNEITQNPFELFAPWLLGGVALMVFTWPLFYHGSLWVVRWARNHHKPRNRIS
jgi:uncharacterized protein (DUF2062 family)